MVFYVVLLASKPSSAQDLLNCDDFPSQAAAQANLRANPSDPNNLDADNDGIACETFGYPAGSPRDETPVALATTQTTNNTSPVTNLIPITNQNNRGGVTAAANPSRKPQRERSVINVPNRPLPPSGGLPVYGVVSGFVLTGAGLLALGLAIRRASRR